MAKGKKNRKNNDADSDVGSEEEIAKVDDTKPTKSKKDRKKKKEAELEEAQKELDALNDGDEIVPSDDDGEKTKKGKSKKQTKEETEETGEENSKTKGKSKGKKGKKKKDDSDSEGEEVVVQKSGFALLLDDDESGSDESEEDIPKPVKKSNKKAGKSKPTFQDLADLDDEELGSGIDSEEGLPNAKVEQASKKGKKAKKGKKKENEADGDDLDQALAELGIEPKPEDGGKKEKKKKKKKKNDQEGDDDDLDKALAELRLEGGIETAPAAEDESAAKKKKKEKKERQKQKEKEKEEGGDDANQAEVAAAADVKEGEDEGGKEEKGKKKKKKGAEKEEKSKGKKPGKSVIAAMQEALKKAQEEDERKRREEEEKIRQEEEAERQRLEQKRLMEERKALKKQKEKEKKEQLKKEGKWLTAKQKEQKARAEAMLEAMRAQGIHVPDAGEKRGPRPGTRVRPNKKKHESAEEVQKKSEEDVTSKETTPVEEEPKTEPTEAETEVKDHWEAEEEPMESWEEVAEIIIEEKKVDEKKEPVSKEGPLPFHYYVIVNAAQLIEEETSESEDDDDEEESEEESNDEESEDETEESEDEESEEEDHPESKKEKALERIEKRRALNEKNRNPNVLRAPVVCVLGHVDTGKTKILDKLRRTNVQDGEAGGITQQIGATNVPIEVIQEQCKMVHNFNSNDLKLPGLLIIDTPGHESFSNLRDRGSSLCDIAILVVDIMHCLEQQTIESINMLKKKKVPFIIALNKIDRIYDWKSNRHKDVSEVVKSQAHHTKLEFEKRAKEVVVAMAEQGLNAALFDENPDPKTYISMVPTSAHTGEGMGNLMALLTKLSQDMLSKRLAFSEELQATVLEVKAIPGLGTTIDIVLLNGTLREGQTMIIAGTDGPIVTVIKALLTPSKMQDLRVKNTYVEHKEIRGSQGVKIAAKELEKAIAGLNVLVAYHPDEVEICKEEIQSRLESVLNSIKVKDRGVFVQASTLGSLEALLEFLKSSKIPFAGVKVGPVVKRDVMKTSVMLEHEAKYAVILAFDVKVERDAQEMADSLGVKIFQADIIYHLFDRFMAYQDELKRQKREEFKHVVVFPCKLRVMPNCVFKSRDPIVCGVIVESGVVRTGTPICVPSKEFLDLGIITSIQSNHKEVETARKGEEVCIKIEPIPGESPKMFGRHFDEKDLLVSKISRASIDACKEYFREDLQKSDWQLIIELKKVFGIM